MKINKSHGTGIVSYDILDINPLEMHEMCAIRTRVFTVLKSHQKWHKGKKLYLSDDDLETIAAILTEFTKDADKLAESAFLKRKKAVNEAMHLLDEDSEAELHEKETDVYATRDI
jgi:hypothetical protein